MTTSPIYPNVPLLLQPSLVTMDSHLFDSRPEVRSRLPRWTEGGLIVSAHYTITICTSMGQLVASYINETPIGSKGIFE